MVMLGGAVGALARYGCQRAGDRWTNLPGWTSIFAVNIIGSFIIGLSYSWLQGTHHINAIHHMTTLHHFKDSESIRMGMGLLVIGFCGGFTTFSTFSLDNLFLAYQRRFQLAFNLLGSVILGTLAAWGGLSLGELLA